MKHTVAHCSTLKEMLDTCGSKYGDRTAFIHNGSCISYRRFRQEALSLGSALAKRGYHGKKIAVLGENSYEWALSCFAVICSGNVLVPIDKELPAPSVMQLLHFYECNTIILSRNYQKKEYACLNCFFMDDLHRLLANCSGTDLPETAGKNELAAIVTTSGTTGDSKGAMISHKNLCYSAYTQCITEKLIGTSLCVLPLHHIYPLISSLMVPFLNGNATVFCPSVTEAGSYLKKYRPHFFCVVPMMMEALYKKIWFAAKQENKAKALEVLLRFSNSLRRYGIDLRRILFKRIRSRLGGNLSLIICGGAYLDKKFAEAFDDFGINVLVGYGLTETCAGITLTRSPAINGDVGIPIAGTDIRIDTPDENSEGEILIKGNGVMLGYYKDTKATNTALQAGWFRTGDLGRIDSCGNLILTGRIKNLIILSNGKNVSPEELENEIIHISGIEEAIVFHRENTLCAAIYCPEDFVLPEKGYFDKKINELNKTLPPYKMISRVIVSSSPFSKNTNGKILRKKSIAQLKLPNQQAAYLAAQTALEKEICAVFAAALNTQTIGMNDSFFTMGGNSLGAVEISSALFEKYGIEPSDIFEHPTPASLIQNRILHKDRRQSRKVAEINARINSHNTTEPEKPRHILLTGASGYLGIHLLQCLLQKGYKVICLLRTPENFHNIWKHYFPDGDFAGAILIKGDITRPNLGLAQEHYDKLAEVTDTVIHTAADVRHAGSYESLEKVNLTGTQNMIAFCLKSGAVLNHTSTTSICGFGACDRLLDEHTLDIGQQIEHNVYIESKYKAEEAVLLAKERGLKANIFRIGNLTWRKDGVFQINAENNGFAARVRAIFKLKAYPWQWKDLAFDFTAVDECADAYIRLAETGCAGKIWHLINPNTALLSHLCSAFIPEASAVTMDKFKEMIRQNESDKDITVLSMYLQMAEKQMNTLVDCKTTVNVLHTLGFFWGAPNLTPSTAALSGFQQKNVEKATLSIKEKVQ